MKVLAVFILVFLWGSSAQAWLGSDEEEEKTKIEEPKLTPTQEAARLKLIVPNNGLLEVDSDTLASYYSSNSGESCIRYSRHLQEVETLNKEALRIMRLNCEHTGELNISWQLLADPLAIEKYLSHEKSERCRVDKMLLGKKTTKKMTDHKCYKLWYPDS